MDRFEGRIKYLQTTLPTLPANILPKYKHKGMVKETVNSEHRTAELLKIRKVTINVSTTLNFNSLSSTVSNSQVKKYKLLNREAGKRFHSLMKSSKLDKSKETERKNFLFKSNFLVHDV